MISKTHCIIVSIFSLLIVVSCSKKTTPARTPEETTTAVIVADTVKAVDTAQSSIKKTDSVLVKKAATPVKAKPKESIPKVIAVGDNAAKKSVDGRLYYDLQGHRYWRNNKDGKYYLYNKSMATDPDFKKVN